MVGLAELAPPPMARPPQTSDHSTGIGRRWWSISSQPGATGSATPAGPVRAERRASAVPVVVIASDPITAEATIGYLRSRPGISVVAPDCLQDACVVVILATTVTAETVGTMQQIAHQAAGREIRFVLVSDGVEAPKLAQVVSCGLVSVISRQEADLNRIADAILAVARGRVELPGVALSGLSGATAAGLQSREVDVLRLIADGMDTVEIAHRLTYSERTIRNIIHGVLSRLDLRNRPHAVAFAFRNGLL